MTVILDCTAFEQASLQGHFTSVLAVDTRLCSSVWSCIFFKELFSR